MTRSILFLVSLTLILVPRVSDACSCAPPSTPQEELRKSDRVFLGAVTSVEVRCKHPGTKPFVWRPGQGVEMVCATSTGEERGFPVRIATFMISENFKGEGSEVTLETALYGALCGVEFAAGEEYVVYANQESRVLTVNLCSRTGVATDQKSGLSVLRGGG